MEIDLSQRMPEGQPIFAFVSGGVMLIPVGVMLIPGGVMLIPRGVMLIPNGVLLIPAGAGITPSGKLRHIDIPKQPQRTQTT